MKVDAGSPAAARFEYDILAGPGADLGRIAIAAEGVDGIRLAADGSLVLETCAGEVRQHPPSAWTEPAPGERVLTEAIYTLGYLFLGGPAPPGPFGACETYGTEDALGCGSFAACP